MNSLDLEIDHKVIDVGCGGGHLVQEISLGVGANGKSIGIDPSKDQLDAANNRCKGLNNIELICSKADKINIEDNFCDRVTSTQTLEYIEDIDPTLGELKRISKRNGGRGNITIPSAASTINGVPIPFAYSFLSLLSCCNTALNSIIQQFQKIDTTRNLQ